MAQDPDRLPGVETFDIVDRLCDKFEAAWGRASGLPPNLNEYVARLPDPDDAILRRKALIWLVKIDLGYRWKDPPPRVLSELALPPTGISLNDDDSARTIVMGMPARPRLETYLELFPELTAAGSVPLELIVAEYRIRENSIEPASLDELIRRFPDRAEELTTRCSTAADTAPVLVDWNENDTAEAYAAPKGVYVPATPPAAPTVNPDMPAPTVAAAVPFEEPESSAPSFSRIVPPWLPVDCINLESAKRFLNESLGESPSNPLVRRYRDSTVTFLAVLLPEWGAAEQDAAQADANRANADRVSAGEVLTPTPRTAPSDLFLSILRKHSDVNAPRSQAELSAACGFAIESREFQDLLRVLSEDLPLISFIEEERTVESPTSASQIRLAHSNLVPAVREWVHAEEMKSAAGRARLALRERTTAWQFQQRADRELLSLAETVQVRRHIPHARQTPLQQHLVRASVRKHVLRTGLPAAVAVLALVFGIGGVFGLLRAERYRGEKEIAIHEAQLARDSLDSANRELQSALRERDAAQREAGTALDAFQKFSADVQSEIARRPGSVRMRKAVLNLATTALQGLKQRFPQNPGMDRALAYATMFLGDLHLHADGRASLARETYAISHQILTQRAESRPGDVQAQRDWAASLDRVGEVQLRLGEPAKCIESLTKSLKIRERLASDSSSDLGLLSDLAETHRMLGDVYLEDYGRMEAEQHFRESMEIRRLIAASAGADARAARQLAWASARLADVRKDEQIALEDYQQALRITATLQEVEEVDETSANLHDAMTSLLFVQNKLIEALPHAVAAVRLRDTLAVKYSDDAELRRERRDGYHLLGAIQRDLGLEDAAVKSFEQSLAIGDVLSKLDPDESSASFRAVAEIRASLGRALLTAGMPRQALDQLKLSREHAESVRKRYPELRKPRLFVALVEYQQGVAMAELTEYETAIKQFDVAAGLLGEVKKSAWLPDRYLDLDKTLGTHKAFCATLLEKEPARNANVLIALARREAQDGHHEDAKKIVEEILQLTEPNADRHYAAAAAYSRCGWATTFDNPMPGEDELDQRREYLRLGWDHLQTAVRDDPSLISKLSQDLDLVGFRSDPKYAEMLIALDPPLSEARQTIEPPPAVSP